MFTALLAVAIQDRTEFRPPRSKAEEKAKFHAERLSTTPGAVRIKAYEERMRRQAASIWQGVPWRDVGPGSQGGRVIDIESPQDRPNELLVAFATGGLYRTINDGDSWESLFDNQSSFGIGDFAVTSDGQTIWVGTGENNSQRTSYAGTGVFKSTDAGKTWTNMGLVDSHHIGRVLIDPKRNDTVWVGSLGPLYADDGQRGVFKTEDGGKTFRHVLKTPEDTGVIDLTLDPRRPDTVYAACWERERRAWNVREGGANSGIWKTTDGGKTWKKLDGFPTGENMGRLAVAVAPSSPDTVYAFCDNQNPEADPFSMDERTASGRLTMRRFLNADLAVLAKDATKQLESFLNGRLPTENKVADVMAQIKDGKLDKPALIDLMLKRNPNFFDAPLANEQVWRSDDAGASWKNVSGRMGALGGYYWDRITVHPRDPKTVYVSGLFLLKSTDGGQTWNFENRNAHVDHHVLWVDPRNPERVANGNDGGIYLSEDGGKNYRHIENLGVAQATTLGLDDKSPYNVYIGLQDNGTMRGPSNYVIGRNDPSAWRTIGGGDGSAIAVDPRNGGDVVFTASQFGSHSGMNQSTNERWNARAPGRDGEPELRYNWLSPILISPHHPDIVYLGSQKLHRSFNQGKKYEDLSGDLTKNREQGNVPFSTMTALSESPFRFGMVYVGCDDGTIKMTPDSGLTWLDIATPEKTKWVSRIVASKWDTNTVYCTQTGYREDDWKPYVWRSTDQGKTWTSIAADLPMEPVNVIREDPLNKDMLFVGTEMGVWVSEDSGKSWMPYGGGLPVTPVHDLLIQPKAKELVIASHARGAWVVALAPVYDLTDDIRKKPIHVWPVDSMVVSDRWGMPSGQEWSRQITEPTVTVKVWTTVPGEWTAALKDKDGKTVKEYKLKATIGHNTFALGLQTKEGDPNAPLKTGTLDDPFEDRRPKYVQPGDYKIEFVAGSDKAEVGFKLTKPAGS